MSRVGNNPVSVPSGVTVSVASNAVAVKGPKGELSQALVSHIDVAVEDDRIVVSRANDARQTRANHGLMRALIASMVTGVTDGFEKKLEIFGVGYRADVKGSMLVMNLGYSHPIEYAVPQGVTVAADKSGIITVSGIDKQQVGQVAAEIRAFRRPDAYKGKGVRYVGERIRLKAGKTAK